VKCFYCDFTSFSGQKAQVERYLSALEAEARRYHDRKPETLYVGGGTPTELSAAQLERLFKLTGTRYAETTVEANPESLSPELLAVLKKNGTTRLSLGLQTTDDALLKAIGRRHTAADFERVYEHARGLGGMALNVDLMFGLPDQTLESFRSSLDFVLKLEPEHLSVYGLQVEDRTLFGRRGVESPQELGREMFELCLDRLASAGYRHYEISNFARPGHESRHNLNYWTDGEYIGLGVGAASHLDGERWTNVDKLKDYCEKASAGEPPRAESERLDGKAKLGEKVLLNFRRIDGFDLDDETERAFAAELEGLEKRGLIRRSGRRAQLTREGVFLANQVAMEFVAPFAEAAR
jgi:oxygen-independent coproporphyrinogen III oxidase